MLFRVEAESSEDTGTLRALHRKLQLGFTGIRNFHQRVLKSVVTAQTGEFILGSKSGIMLDVPAGERPT